MIGISVQEAETMVAGQHHHGHPKSGKSIGILTGNASLNSDRNQWFCSVTHWALRPAQEEAEGFGHE